MDSCKQSYQQLPGHKECTGCGACIEACNKNVLMFTRDEEGFSYPNPVNSDKCVECGLCCKSCHLLKNEYLRNSVIDGYIAQSHLRYKTKKSASGGAFYTIAKFFIENYNGVVFGAAYNDDFTVSHIQVETIKDLKKLQGSKYVQSELCSIYTSVKDYLTKGRYVLFSGTPCQVAGLKSFLKKDYSNLFLIDIICHGVTSPLLLKDYVNKIECFYKCKIKGIRFRWKNPLYTSRSSFGFFAKMSDNKRIYHLFHDDPYFHVYASGYAFREGCYNCKYANLSRVGDITIGDCDSYKNYLDFHPYESNSSILINTNKASLIWNEKLKSLFDYNPLDIQLEASWNKQLNSPFIRPQARDVIYNEWYSATYPELLSRYGRKLSRFAKIKFFVLMIIPPFIQRIIWRER